MRKAEHVSLHNECPLNENGHQVDFYAGGILQTVGKAPFYCSFSLSVNILIIKKEMV